MSSEFLRHSFIHIRLFGHYKAFDIRALWECEGQSGSVSGAGPRMGPGSHGEREDHFTPVTSHSHPAWARWKTPIRGAAIAPTACLATIPPHPTLPSLCPHIHCVFVWVCVYVFMCMLHSPSLFLSPCISSLSFLQPLRSAWSLTCILRGPYWHICPRLVMPLWVWISVWMLSIAAPADSLSDFLTGNRKGLRWQE